MPNQPKTDIKNIDLLLPRHHKNDIQELVKKIKSLNNALDDLSDPKDLKELLIIIKQPGWTTPAEFLFASGIVDSLLDQTTNLIKLKNSLVKGSRKVSFR